jgi:hypothetical protein
MTRTSSDQYDPSTGYLLNGYDYVNQAWVGNGKYIRCGHVEVCDCYGRWHAGEACETTKAMNEGTDV